MYRPIDPIAPGSYRAFETASDEAIQESVKGALVASAAGPVCPRCDGWGSTKDDGRIACGDCHGIGVLT